MIQKLAQFTDIRCCLVVGGLSTKVCSQEFHYLFLAYSLCIMQCYVIGRIVPVFLFPVPFSS